MNRRRFLAAAIGALFQPLVSALPLPAGRKLVDDWGNNWVVGVDEALTAAEYPFTIVMHPSQMRDVERVHARDLWYSHWRNCRTDGRRDEALGTFSLAPLMTFKGEIGEVLGVRIKQSMKLEPR